MKYINGKKLVCITLLISILLSACSFSGENGTAQEDRLFKDMLLENSDLQLLEDDNAEESLDEIEIDYSKPILEKQLLVAHRGNSVSVPENTIAAFKSAKESGTDMIELDVQMTKDNVIVVFHDTDMERVTGEPGLIANHTYEELLEMDITSWFDGRYKWCDSERRIDYSTEKMPTLREVLAVAKECEMGVDIEFKSIGDTSNFTEEEIDWFINEVIDEVEEYDMADDVLFTSFNYNYLEAIEERNSEYKTLFITNVLDMDVILERCHTDGIALAQECIKYDTISRLHQAGLIVLVWTVNEYPLMKYLLNAGADGIITNYVGAGHILL